GSPNDRDASTATRRPRCMRASEPAPRAARTTELRGGRTMIATDVAVTQLPLTATQREWVERAWTQIDPERLAKLDLELTGIPSPTGEERAVAEFLADHLGAAG